MKNPWIILLSCAVVLFIGFALNSAPPRVEDLASRLYADKVLHFSAGFLLGALAVVLLGFERPLVVFWFVFVIGVGWEITQIFVDIWHFRIYWAGPVLDVYDFFGDTAGDMLGVLAYYFLYMHGR